MRHQNRVAIATGATQNIGLASARRLANERAAVPMVDLQDEKGELEAQRLQADGGQAAYLHADLDRPRKSGRGRRCGAGSIRPARHPGQQCRPETGIGPDKPGRGRGLAGTIQGDDDGHPVADAPRHRSARAQWRRRDRKRGLGSRVADRNRPHHLRHAAIAPTRVAAIDLGLRGIRVNAICPGLIVTDRLQAGINAHPGVMKAGRKIFPWGAAVDRMR